MAKIKILMVMGALDYCNGVSSYAMNYYRHFNREDFAIDFAVHYDYHSDYVDEIVANGNKVIFMGDYSLRSLLTLKGRIRKLLKSGGYDIIHCHITNLSYFYFSEAKKQNINVRILHSHATQNSDNKIKNFRNGFLKKIGLKYTTDFFACSNLAGKYLFGTREFKVIRNAIDYRKFFYSEESNSKLRDAYGINAGTVVLGFIGRFTNQKNIPFLIDIATELKNRRFDFKLFLIGDGKEQPKIIDSINSNGLNGNVVLVKSNTQIAQYYSLFDIMLLPSFFEGLPVTGIEAQVASCRCLFSDRITEETVFTDNCRFLPIESVDGWIEEIVNFERKDRSSALIPDDFNIETESSKLESLYNKLISERIH